MKRLAACSIALVSALMLSACGGEDSTEGAAAGGAPATSSAEAAEPTATPDRADDSAAAVAGSYITYDEFQSDQSSYGEGDVVLFFHASWCPKCQETEENLNASGVPDGLTVVKVDFDSSTDLRQKYGVTLQHTFVQIDADGNQVAKWNGSYTADAIVSETV